MSLTVWVYFLCVAIVASQMCEIVWHSPRIRTSRRCEVIQGHLSL